MSTLHLGLNPALSSLVTPSASASASAAATPSSTSPSTSSNTQDSVDALGNPDTFLQLLVAQLKYQDPESPADGTQFVTQLATFAGVEQQSTMRSDLDSINQIAEQWQASQAQTTPTAPSAPATPATPATPTTPATPSASN